MLGYRCKLIWNNRKRFWGIFLEQALVFIVLTSCGVSLLSALAKYRTPGMLDTRGVMLFGYTTVDPSANDLKEVAESMDAVVHDLKMSPNVEHLSEGLYLAPYLRSDEYNYWDSIRVERRGMKVLVKFSDGEGMAVYRPALAEGRWLPDGRGEGSDYPMVVTQDVVEAMQWHSGVGKRVTFQNVDFTIVGVIEGLKNDLFVPSRPTVILPLSLLPRDDYREAAARVKDKLVFSRDFYRAYAKRQESESVMPYLVDLDEVRGSAVMGHLTGILVQLVPTLFLLLFSLVGTVGVFRLNARRRVREYALRVAVGCPRRRVFREMLAESLLVTAFALVPGLIVSLWVYGNTAVEWLGVWLAVGVMLLFSFLGALQPALAVKRLEITKALNDE